MRSRLSLVVVVVEELLLSKCLLTAFNFSRTFTNGGVDEEEEEKKREEERSEEDKVKSKVEKSLEFSEFRMFLMALRQYYIYCQVA